MINSKPHQEALEYALDVIRKSPLFPYVVGIYLFGSCAKKTENPDSDVDLLLELSPSANLTEELRVPLRLLKSDVMTDSLDDPEVDLKIVVGEEWRTSPMLFFKNVRKDGIQLFLNRSAITLPERENV